MWSAIFVRNRSNRIWISNVICTQFIRLVQRFRARAAMLRARPNLYSTYTWNRTAPENRFHVRFVAETLPENITSIGTKCSANAAAKRISPSWPVKCVRAFSHESIIYANICADTWANRHVAKIINVHTARNRSTDHRCWIFTFGRTPARSRFCKFSLIKQHQKKKKQKFHFNFQLRFVWEIFPIERCIA